jgi:hypothetical protein
VTEEASSERPSSSGSGSVDWPSRDSALEDVPGSGLGYLVGVGIAGPGSGNEMGSGNESGGGEGGTGGVSGDGDVGGLDDSSTTGGWERGLDCTVLYDKGVEDLIGVSGICIFMGS